MKKLKNDTGIPDYVLESVARMLLPKIQKMFEDEQVRKEFEEWKKAKDEEKSKSHNS